MAESLHFRISSALKDIIGRDLITDDYIAVFELVKNSYDAYASRVDIYFENIYTENPKIIIKDNGKGMDLTDLKEKWLFVAYSAKKEGTEDQSFDYRDKIYKNRIFAGAKGIGRFSCDRLGRFLYLETTKKKDDPQTEVLITNWENFENNLRDEFVDISVLHETKEKSDYDLQHGTILEITGLRNEWNRVKLLHLKDSLAKLINPSESQNDNTFEIYLYAPEEEYNDSHHTEYYSKVNGEVKNFIFETLGLKTTKIVSTISNDGKYKTTELKDGGTLIYKIKEINNYDLLDSINYTVYFLNMSAKLTFASRMGLSSRQYGHIFLYKNGFRIYPYGEPGEDPLKIDVRHAQGYSRFLGTRDLIGQIEIFSTSAELKETSSRGDGLIKTKAYLQLENCFWETLKRLEKYVVDVQKWGLSIEDDSSLDVQSRIQDLIARLSGSSDIIEIEYAEDLLQIVEKNQTGSADTIIKNLQRIAIESGNETLIAEANLAAEKLQLIRLAKEEAEQETEVERQKAKVAEDELSEKVSENLFLRSIKSQEFDEVISFLHHVGISANIIDNYLAGLYSRLNDSSNKEIIEEFEEPLRISLFETKKIINICKFATRANFKLFTEAIDIKLGEYFKEYTQNIVSLSSNNKTEVKFINKIGEEYEGKFKPIELNIIVDNLFSNAKKAGATKFHIFLQRNAHKKVELVFEDDGKGISKLNLNKVFNLGYTTTSGSGIGLFHVYEIVKAMKAEIKVESEEGIGTKFIIELP